MLPFIGDVIERLSQRVALTSGICAPRVVAHNSKNGMVRRNDQPCQNACPMLKKNAPAFSPDLRSNLRP
jgi:hypothetical protein